MPTDRERILAHIVAKPSVTMAELSASLGINVRQVRKTIDELRSDGGIWRKGGKAGTWVATNAEAERERNKTNIDKQ